MKVWLQFLYWLVVVPAGALSRLIGRDPLLLRRSAARKSYWAPLVSTTNTGDYLSPADPENRPRGAAGWVAPLLRAGVRRPAQSGSLLAEARPQDIPDEIYTLW